MNFRKSFVAAAAFALAVSAVPVKAEENQDELFAEFLEEEVGFSFTDVAVLKAFHDPDQLGS